jgi:hypothetical protein
LARYEDVREKVCDDDDDERGVPRLPEGTRPPCPVATTPTVCARFVAGDGRQQRRAREVKPKRAPPSKKPYLPTLSTIHPHPSIISQGSLAWIDEFTRTGDIAAAHAPTPSPASAEEGEDALAFA